MEVVIAKYNANFRGERIPAWRWRLFNKGRLIAQSTIRHLSKRTAEADFDDFNSRLPEPAKTKAIYE